MTLREHLKQVKPDAKVSLCNESSFHYDRNEKIYDAFFVGEAADVPTEALTRTVIKSFSSFMWQTESFILQE